MDIKECNIKFYQAANFKSLKGIYKITNIVNNKVYIGSTCNSFIKRWSTHFQKLRKNNHPNDYLQNAYNKYKEDSFVVEILYIGEEYTEILDKEQYYIDFFQSYEKEKGYNLDKCARKIIKSERTKQKISNTLKQKYQSGELKARSGKTGLPSWNKGKKCDNISITRRNIFDSIGVYNLTGELIVIFRSCIDLIEWSEKNEMPFLKVVKNNRIGHILRRDKIYSSIRNNIPYKGLIFKKEKPLSPEMGIAKWVNSGEGCDANPEPSLKYT